MPRIIEQPPRDAIRKWGPLAHVDERERERILEMTADQRARELKRIDKELKAAKKRRKI